jgi:beta-aspartyl-peptidase (threonine type)
MTASQQICLAEALHEGYEALRRGAQAIAAVETAIQVLEASGLFNAGVGSRLQLDGARRMDASLMEGRDLRAGAVAGIEEVRHPITAARLVMENTSHVLLVGAPATRLARHFKLDRQPSPTGVQRELLKSESRKLGTDRMSKRTLLLFGKLARRRSGRLPRATGLETVGAVARDREGTVAAGASTGGIALMLPGRVGDSPLIGCGIYADDEAGAVSMTGVGEGIIRIAVAKEITDRLAAGSTPQAAVRLVLAKLAARVKGSAGALVLARDGRFAIRHNTPRMTAGYWDGTGKPVIKDNYE